MRAGMLQVYGVLPTLNFWNELSDSERKKLSAEKLRSAKLLPASEINHSQLVAESGLLYVMLF